ncbi:MAG: cysteine--tRNA ligase [bacterium]|nr:cysteine--tRNA ligase [bacterium]
MILFNTLSRSNEDFTTLEEGKVKLYTCGLTVYSQPHVGNWVAYIYWDLLVRTLRASGYEVEHVQNITDVGHLTSDEDAGEDKMIKGALKEGMTAWEVAEKYIKIAEDEAYNQLGLTRPTHMPRATDFIHQQIDFVNELETKGYVYNIEDGMYFDTSKFSEYGKMARLDIDGLQFGARVADTGKKNPTDFAVWKFSSPAEKRDMEWDSPSGSKDRKGFPGWHLECSVMAKEILGDQIDIHTGGIDHIPVHHTNEIAQSEAITEKRFSNYWLHANHIKVDGTKISKSLGNIYTLQDIKNKGFDMTAFKLMVLSKHYRTEGNFSWEILQAAQNRLNNWLAVADRVWQLPEQDDIESADAVLISLQNDMDSPEALSLVDQAFDQAVKTNKSPSRHLLDTIEQLLGIKLVRSDLSEEQKQLVQERLIARENKNWAASDDIRDKLLATGIELKDSGSTVIWNHKT